MIVQANPELGNERVTVALITSDLQRLPHLRVPLEGGDISGLRRVSEIAVDNLQTFSISKIGQRVGVVPAATMATVDHALRLYLGL